MHKNNVAPAVAGDFSRADQEVAPSDTEELYRNAVELSGQHPWMSDAEGRVLQSDVGWRRLLGLPLGELPTGAWMKLIHPDDVPGLLAVRYRSLATGEPYRYEYRIMLADGNYRWFLTQAGPKRDETGAIVRWYGTISDIHDRKQAEERLRSAAYHDDLTGLANRRLLLERLQQALKEAAKAGRRVGLLTIDLDDFKHINDRYGHDGGNEFLRAFGSRLIKLVGLNDTVARLGGDEFAVVLSDLVGEAEVATVARAILDRMKEPIRLTSTDAIDYHASIGGTISTGTDTDADEMLKQADLALNFSGQAGRGVFRMFNPAMREGARKTISALDLAGNALMYDWLEPFYQPKVVLSSGKLGGFEALLRLRHPQRGLQSPGIIAPAFDDTALGTAIGERMRLRIFRDMRNWISAGIEIGRIAINASAAEFRHDNYAERVLEELARMGVPAHHLEVEVTESVFLGSGAEYVERALQTLHAAGVSIALDDFGTGYASLSHLKRFPVDVIKIDCSFVRDMETERVDAAIISAVLSLSQKLGVRVVAEGVENATQILLLREQGCTLGQGYYFGRAKAAAEVPPYVEKMATSASTGA